MLVFVRVPSLTSGTEVRVCRTGGYRSTFSSVEYHLGNIYAKCGVRGRQQLRRFVEQWRKPAAV